MNTKMFLIEPMFAFKQGNKMIFNMSNKMFYLTEDEMRLMVENGTSRDEIISYVFQLLSKKRLADFSEIGEVFNERLNS